MTTVAIWLLFSLCFALGWAVLRLECRCSDLEEAVNHGRLQRVRLMASHALLCKQNAEVLEAICLATEQYEHIAEIRKNAENYRRLSGEFDELLRDEEGDS